MNPTIAEFIAYLSLFSAIVPFFYGLWNRGKLSKYFQLLIIPIFVSLFFDIFSFANRQFSWKLFEVSLWFDPLAIIVWGFLYHKLFQQLSQWKNIFTLFWFVAVGLAVYTILILQEELMTNYLGANIYNLFHIVSSLTLVTIILFRVKNWNASNLALLMILLFNLVYFAIIVGVFAFFYDLDPSEMMKVFTIKWIAYILYNFALVFIFYYATKIDGEELLELG